MINLMNENGLLELEVEKDGMRIRLKKTGSAGENYSAPIIVERKLTPHDQSQASEQPAQIHQDKAIEIKAPMVGTFYRAPSPEASAYVEPGQIVEPGQVICVIEAMKLMNEIKSEIKGKILEILMDNAEPIEFGQPMFLVEPL